MNRLALILPVALLLPGCIAKTALNVATMPVKAVSQGADWATTSQDESDRNYGRQMREQEERDGKAAKRAAKQRRQACEDAGYRDCD